MRTHGYTDDTLWICKAGHQDEHKFAKCLFCDKFHSCNSYVFRNAQCLKCGKAGHIQKVITLFI